MNLVKLEGPRGAPVWVNPEHVVALTSHVDDSLREYTKLTLSTPYDMLYHVDQGANATTIEPDYNITVKGNPYLIALAILGKGHEE